MGQLSGSGAIFLSASVPDPQNPNFIGPGDSAAISAAVSALLFVTLGRRRLIWGGHPAITPMIWAVAEAIDVDYGAWVKLYQSRIFEDLFPEENAYFKNVVLTEDRGDRESSLRFMREQMLRENEFEAAVFIGGMRGVIDEYDLVRADKRAIRIIPIISTGGATLALADAPEGQDPDLRFELDYVALLHKKLDIDTNEERYRTPREQPPEVADRLVRPRRR